jgi:hypothetical protein
MSVRKAFTTLLLLGCLFATAAGAATFEPAPNPGPKGLEEVPIPQVPVLAPAQAVKLGEKIDGIECQRLEKVAFHIHAHLVIFVKGKQRQIPFGIGIGGPLGGYKDAAGPFVTSGSCFMWLHTHTADGIIHMEAPKQISFVLGEFFDIWGQKLSPTQVGPDKGKVTALVDGKIYQGNPRSIPLKAHTQIQLEVGTPLVAMETIKFGQL